MRGGDDKRAPFPATGREPSPSVRRVFVRVRPSVHPDRSLGHHVLETRVPRNDGVRYGINFFPHVERPHAVRLIIRWIVLALMLRQRHNSRTPRFTGAAARWIER